MELERSEDLLVFLDCEKFASLCLAIFRNDSLPGTVFWTRFCYEGVQFDIINGEDGPYIEITN